MESFKVGTFLRLVEFMYCMHKVKLTIYNDYIQTDMQKNYNITCSTQYKAV